MKNKIFVIIYYSFDYETSLYKFNSEEEAIKFIKNDYENELKISNSNISKSHFHETGFAQIHYDNNEFVEWNIAILKN